MNLEQIRSIETTIALLHEAARTGRKVQNRYRTLTTPGDWSDPFPVSGIPVSSDFARYEYRIMPEPRIQYLVFGGGTSTGVIANFTDESIARSFTSTHGRTYAKFVEAI